MAKKKKESSFADYKAMSPDELKEKLGELKKETLNLRFQKSGGQLENTARVRTVRRDIARIKTVLNAQSAQEK